MARSPRSPSFARRRAIVGRPVFGRTAGRPGPAQQNKRAVPESARATRMSRCALLRAGAPGGQLKILQEVITLSIFVPFSMFYLKEPLKLDYLWAGLCLVGAAYFMFRSRMA